MTEPNTGTEPLSRIEAALEHLGEELEPPPGWEARVLAATAPPPQRRWWRWLAAPVGALAAVLVFWLWSATRVVALVLEVTAERGAVRGADGERGADGVRSARVGQHLRVHIAGGSGHRMVWIYHNNEIMKRCPGDAACGDLDGDLGWTVDSIGTYEIVALDGDAMLPALRGNYDADLAAARTAGFTTSEKKVKVR